MHCRKGKRFNRRHIELMVFGADIGKREQGYRQVQENEITQHILFRLITNKTPILPKFQCNERSKNGRVIIPPFVATDTA